MRSTGRWLIVVALTASVAGAQGAPNQRRPYIGYLCAAGGQKGTTIRITVGGQNLRGSKRVIVSGEGVTGTVIRHRRSPWLLRPEVRREVAQRLRRLANQKATGRKTKPPRKAPKKKPGKDGAMEKPVPWPDHPMLKNLDSLTPKELRRVAYEFLDPARRSQLSPQVAEAVEIEVRIAADALPGFSDLSVGAYVIADDDYSISGVQQINLNLVEKASDDTGVGSGTIPPIQIQYNPATGNSSSASTAFRTSSTVRGRPGRSCCARARTRSRSTAGAVPRTAGPTA